MAKKKSVLDKPLAKKTSRQLSANGVKPTKGREICVLGYAEETRDMVHGLPETVDIYAINMASVFLGKRKAHTWFQLHPRSWTTGGRKPTGYWGRPKEHLEFLQEFEGDIYMSYEEPDVPNCKVFDIDKVLGDLRLDATARHYFTSTFAYIMALAISEKPSKIYLYGINLTALDEYTKQRNCMEYWIGQAEGRGIEIEIPTESALCKAPDYGLTGKSQTEEMEVHSLDRIQHIKEKYMEAAFNVNTAESLRADSEFWVGVLSKVADQTMQEWEKVKTDSRTLKAMIAGIENLGEQIQATIQEQISNRIDTTKEMSQRMHAEVNSRQGQLKEATHLLGLLGVIDVKAPAVPGVRYPSEEMSKEIQLPKPTAV